MIQIAPNHDINTIHEITGVKNAYEKLGLTGKGVKVGIIDSGIYKISELKYYVLFKLIRLLFFIRYRL